MAPICRVTSTGCAPSDYPQNTPSKLREGAEGDEDARKSPLSRLYRFPPDEQMGPHAESPSYVSASMARDIYRLRHGERSKSGRTSEATEDTGLCQHTCWLRQPLLTAPEQVYVVVSRSR